VKARIGAAIIAVVLALYLVLVSQRAYLLLTSGDPVGIAMGVALFVLPAIAAWAIGRELWFGMRAESLGRRLEREGALPDEQLSVRPSGRVDRDEAEALFPKYRDEVESAPEDWRAWYRLGLAYDGAGDRRRARSAIRQAIRFESAERRGDSTSHGER
jgi:cytochrome c-type biogenesis protein CcmH/NrfG